MSGTLRLNDTTFATETNGNITTNVSELKINDQTVIDSNKSLNVSDVKVGGNTVIDSNRKMTGVDIVPTTNFTFRNKIINGNFDIWQRGTSQTSSGYGSADRWIMGHTGSTKTASQQAFTVGQTDVPGNPKYYLRHVVSSVTGTGNYCTVQHKIEGVQTLAGQTATLSFWAKADSNKSIATEFIQNFGTGGSPSTGITGIQVVTHNLTTSWQKFTATVTIPSISGKTIGSDNRDWIGLYFWFDAGSNFNSRTNSLGQQSGTFDIAQVQLEEGPVSTPFEHRPYGTELALCQRYYLDVGEFFTSYIASGFNITTTLSRFGYYLPVQMRATPSFSNNGILCYSTGTNPTLGTLSIGMAGNRVFLHYNSTGGATGDFLLLFSAQNNYFNAEL